MKPHPRWSLIGHSGRINPMAIITALRCRYYSCNPLSAILCAAVFGHSCTLDNSEGGWYTIWLTFTHALLPCKFMRGKRCQCCHEKLEQKNTHMFSYMPDTQTQDTCACAGHAAYNVNCLHNFYVGACDSWVYVVWGDFGVFCALVSLLLVPRHIEYVFTPKLSANNLHTQTTDQQITNK